VGAVVAPAAMPGPRALIFQKSFSEKDF